MIDPIDGIIGVVYGYFHGFVMYTAAHIGNIDFYISIRIARIGINTNVVALWLSMRPQIHNPRIMVPKSRLFKGLHLATKKLWMLLIMLICMVMWLEIYLIDRVITKFYDPIFVIVVVWAFWPELHHRILIPPSLIIITTYHRVNNINISSFLYPLANHSGIIVSMGRILNNRTTLRCRRMDYNPSIIMNIMYILLRLTMLPTITCLPIR